MEHHHHHEPRKFVLRTTCLKNGGFRKYQSLPPQEVFQHAYWVLGSEMDIKIKRKQTLFNRETDWMFLPVYLTTNKGLLFVYISNESGYVLRISSALKLSFEGTKKAKKRQQANGPNFTYFATIVLQFHFGELHLRFNDCENLRPWRAILLAAHQSQNGISKIGEFVAREIFGSTSLESVVSTQSVYPEADDKDKAERVEIHRHALVSSPESNAVDNGNGSASSTAVTSTRGQSSAHSKSPGLKSVSDVIPYNEADELIGTLPYNEGDEMNGDFYLAPKGFRSIESESNESLLGQDVQVPYTAFSPSLATSKSQLTSEVDVTFNSSASAFKDSAPAPPYTPFSPSHEETSKFHLSSETDVSFNSLLAREDLATPAAATSTSSRVSLSKPTHIPSQTSPKHLDVLEFAARKDSAAPSTSTRVSLSKPAQIAIETSPKRFEVFESSALKDSIAAPSMSTRIPLSKPPQIAIETSPKHLEVLEFWHQKRTEPNGLDVDGFPTKNSANTLKSKYDEAAPKPTPLKVSFAPICTFESVGEESQEKVAIANGVKSNEMIKEGGYVPRKPISVPNKAKRSKMLEFWRQKETESGGLPISYSNSEI